MDRRALILASFSAQQATSMPRAHRGMPAATPTKAMKCLRGSQLVFPQVLLESSKTVLSKAHGVQISSSLLYVYFCIGYTAFPQVDQLLDDTAVQDLLEEILQIDAYPQKKMLRGALKGAYSELSQEDLSRSVQAFILRVSGGLS